MSTKRTYKSPLRSKQKNETVDAIIQAALHLHGKGETRLEALADEAGVSVATVRKYFPTQEDIYRGCTQHFLETYPLPSLEELSNIESLAERIRAIVHGFYELHEASFGQTWLAFKLENESKVMKATLDQAAGFIGAAVELLFKGWESELERNPEELKGYIRGLLSPLTYRALRLYGGLNMEQCILFTSSAVANALGITLQKQ